MSEAEDTKTKRFKKRWLGLGVLVALSFYVFAELTIPRFPFGPYKLYSDLNPEQRKDFMSYERLTDEINSPFQRGVSDRDYTAALVKFPDTKSCLVKEEQNKARPDLRFIDWDKIRNVEDADVCVWRIFSSLNSSARANQWLVFHNAHIVDRPINTLAGEWGAKMPADVPYPTRGFKFFTNSWASPGMFVHTTWEENGKLKSVYWRRQDPL